MTTTTLATEKLTDIERADLGQHEQTIKAGLKSFIEVGSALLDIRDRRLYRETHPTFEEYCRQKWNMTGSRAYQLINSAEVMAELKSQPLVERAITNERQTRALKKVPKGQKGEVVRRAMATGTVTAKSISHVANGANGTTGVNGTAGTNGTHDAGLPEKFRAAMKSKVASENWWIKTRKPEARGRFIEFVVSIDLPVVVTNKEDFKKRVLRWLDTVQEQKVTAAWATKDTSK